MSFINILRVVKAKIIIKTKIFFRYPLNIFYFIINPVIWISPFYFMSKVFTVDGTLQGFKDYTGSNNYVSFLIIGYMVSSYTATALWSVGFSLKQEMVQGVLETNWTTPVNRSVLMLSNTIFEFLKATLEIIFTGITCYFIFGFTVNKSIFKAILFLLPGIIALMGIGLMVASGVLLLKNANNLVDISSSVLDCLVGTFFPIQILPRYLIPICLAIPVTFMNDGVRGILINQETLFSLKYEFLALVVAMVFFIIAGNAVFNSVEKRCRKRGLSGY